MPHRRESKDGGDDTLWCILRTSGSSTVRLARTLTSAGFDAWTPRLVRRWYRRRTRDWAERETSIVPSFVFARVEQIHDLIAATAAPLSPHPPFQVFTHAGKVGVVFGDEFAQIRAVEAAVAEEYAALIAEEERLAAMNAAKAERERRRQRFEQKQAVRIDSPAFLGVQGVVEAGGDKLVKVRLDNGMIWNIGTWLLDLDAVPSHPSLDDLAA